MKFNISIERIRHSDINGEVLIKVNGQKLIQVDDTMSTCGNYGAEIHGWRSVYPDHEFTLYALRMLPEAVFRLANEFETTNDGLQIELTVKHAYSKVVPQKYVIVMEHDMSLCTYPESLTGVSLSDENYIKNALTEYADKIWAWLIRDIEIQ